MASATNNSSFFSPYNAQFSIDQLMTMDLDLSDAIEPYVQKKPHQAHIDMSALHCEWRERHLKIMFAHESETPVNLDDELRALNDTCAKMRVVCGTIPDQEGMLKGDYALYLSYVEQTMKENMLPIGAMIQNEPEHVSLFPSLPGDLSQAIGSCFRVNELAKFSSVNRAWNRTCQSFAGKIYRDYIYGIKNFECEVLKARGPAVAVAFFVFFGRTSDTQTLLTCTRERVDRKMLLVRDMGNPDGIICNATIGDIIENFILTSSCPYFLGKDLSDCLNIVRMSESYQKDPETYDERVIELIDLMIAQKRFGEAFGLVAGVSTGGSVLRFKILTALIAYDPAYTWAIVSGSGLLQSDPEAATQLARAIPERCGALRAEALAECAALPPVQPQDEQKD